MSFGWAEKFDQGLNELIRPSQQGGQILCVWVCMCPLFTQIPCMWFIPLTKAQKMKLKMIRRKIARHLFPPNLAKKHTSHIENAVSTIHMQGKSRMLPNWCIMATYDLVGRKFVSEDDVLWCLCRVPVIIAYVRLHQIRHRAWIWENFHFVYHKSE